MPNFPSVPHEKQFPVEPSERQAPEEFESPTYTTIIRTLMAMTKQLLDDVEQICADYGRAVPDRSKLLSWMSMELNELSSMLPADWFFAIMSPVTTSNGIRGYDLPSNFGTNFIRHAGQRLYQILNLVGDKWACWINTGSNDSLLGYESPMQFYSKNLDGESEGRPSVYTIMSASNGTRQIQVSTKPDTNGGNNYTISGVYLPTDWTLTSESQVPVLPNNSPILKYGVLRRLLPNIYETKYDKSLANLYLIAACERVGQLVPVLGRSGKDEYQLSKRRF